MQLSTIFITQAVPTLVLRGLFLPRDASSERGDATVSRLYVRPFARLSVCLSVCLSVGDV